MDLHIYVIQGINILTKVSLFSQIFILFLNCTAFIYLFYYSVFVWMHVCVWEGVCIYVRAYYDKSVKITAQLEGTMWVSETKFRSPVLWKILLANETSFLPLFLIILKWPFLIFYDILIINSVLRFLFNTYYAFFATLRTLPGIIN